MIDNLLKFTVYHETLKQLAQIAMDLQEENYTKEDAVADIMKLIRYLQPHEPCLTRDDGHD